MNAKNRRPAPEASATAALFIDFENLYDAFQDRGDGDRLALAELLNSAARTVQATYDAEVVLCKTYGDFSNLPDGPDYQSQLSRLGCEVEQTDCAYQHNASEMCMAIDAADLARHRSDINVVVLITGDRPFLPLVRKLRSLGKRVVLFGSDLPSTSVLAGLYSRPMVDVRQLFSLTSGEERDAQPVAKSGPQVEYQPVTDAAGLETLRIIDEHFGKYDEVYLTPLLRKLSELMPDEDPKTVIGELEEAGAVWLDKRHGFPYDYTVLVTDDEHPTVRQIRIEADEDYVEAGSDDRPSARELTPKRAPVTVSREMPESVAD